MTWRNREGSYKAVDTRAANKAAFSEYLKTHPEAAEEHRLILLLRKTERSQQWKDYAKAIYITCWLAIKNGEIVIHAKLTMGCEKNLSLGKTYAEVIRNLEGYLNG
jgi:hypothetical protein